MPERPKSAPDARGQKLAAALKENLKRRKAQARARLGVVPPESQAAPGAAAAEKPPGGRKGA